MSERFTYTENTNEMETEKEIKQKFLKLVLEIVEKNDYFKKREAQKMLEKFGDKFDFTAEIKKGMTACLPKISLGDVECAHGIKYYLGENIDFTDIKGYEEAIKKAFPILIKSKKYSDRLEAVYIKKELGGEIDFKSIEGYEDSVKNFYLERLSKGSL